MVILFLLFVLPSLVWQPRAMMGAHVEPPGGSVCECTVSAPYPSTRVADCDRLMVRFHLELRHTRSA